jgi:hypothetical protein
MDYVILVLLACALGAGVGGGMLSAWSCHRRLLALEENLKIILDAYDIRLKRLSDIVIRQDKVEAAKIRWSKKEQADHDLAALLKEKAEKGDALTPWDPRLWAKD